MAAVISEVRPSARGLWIGADRLSCVSRSRCLHTSSCSRTTRRGRRSPHWSRPSPHRVTVLPRQDATARACLEALQATTRSPLGAIAHETGGMLIDHGWLRLLGSVDIGELLEPGGCREARGKLELDQRLEREKGAVLAAHGDGRGVRKPDRFGFAVAGVVACEQD